MSVPVEIEVRFLINCSENVGDTELASIIRGLRQNYPPKKISQITKCLMKKGTEHADRVACMMLTTTTNQPPTGTPEVNVASTPGLSRELSESNMSTNSINDQAEPLKCHQKRLKDPIYKELLMCLLDQSEYNPVTKNLDRTPRQIMTEELMTEVLKKACKDPSYHLPYNALVSYIQTLTKRLSKSGFVRKNGKPTDLTTYYDEYMAVFGWTDPYKLKESTEEAQKTLTKATENEREQTRMMIEETLRQIDSMVQTKKRIPAEERLRQLKLWVQEQRTNHGIIDGAPFRCPKPRNGSKNTIERQLGAFINSKVYEARNKKNSPEIRLKAIEMLNGPIAEELGREENWWTVPQKPHSALKKRPVINEENRTDNKPKRVRPPKRQSAVEEQVTAGPVATWVRSSRARAPKPNTKFSNGDMFLGRNK